MSYPVITLAPAELDVSLVVPVKDEVENVAELAAEVTRAMEQTQYSWECIWVDDGSTDGTTPRLAELQRSDPRHVLLPLARNFGQSAALAAGFRAARGARFATLDGDGQSDPADIPRAPGGARGAGRRHGERLAREAARQRGAQALLEASPTASATASPHESVRDVGCSVRVFQRAAVENLLVFRGMHRFLPTLVRINGHPRILEVPVHHRPRLRGRTKYGINNRLWVGIGDTFAVSWMQHRLVAPEVRSLSRGELDRVGR